MEQYRELHIRELRKLIPGQTINDNLADDLFLAELSYSSRMDILQYPCRFDGFLVFMCYEGSFEVELNLRTYAVEAGSMLVYTPGNIVRVSHFGPEEKRSVRFAVAAISRELITSTRMDFNKLHEESLRVLENPGLRLEADEIALGQKYFDLIRDISGQPLPNIREAVVTLISSTFYWAGSLWMKRVSDAQRLAGGKSTHARIILEDFLKLVQEHHTRERELSFYADSLYLIFRPADQADRGRAPFPQPDHLLPLLQGEDRSDALRIPKDLSPRRVSLRESSGRFSTCSDRCRG